MRTRYPFQLRSSVRRLVFIRLTVALGAMCVLACEGQKPPVACETIPSQTLTVDGRVWVTPCFEDPEMGEITLSAESSAPEVATVVVHTRVVEVLGVSPGDATISVTGADPENMTGELSFSILVPNRAPLVFQPIPPLWLLPEARSHTVLSEYFLELDHQELTYSAESSDLGVASASVLADTLITSGVSLGRARVTVTATDPGGLTAVQPVEVVVANRDSLFHDTFESDASLKAWGTSDAQMEINEGILRIANTHGERQGWALMPMEAAQWEIAAKMGNAHQGGWAQLVMIMQHVRFPAYVVQIGDDNGAFGLSATNYRVFVFDAADQTWKTRDGWYGQSDAVRGLGELTDVTVSAVGGYLTVFADTTELVSSALAGLPDRMDVVGLGIWPDEGATGKVGMFDRLSVIGIGATSPEAVPRFHPRHMRAVHVGVKVMSQFRRPGSGSDARPTGPWFLGGRHR